MATSSAFSTSNQYIKYSISVTQNSQSIANNTSNVTVSVRFWRTNTGYTTYGNGTVYCTINGTQYSSAVTSSQKITSSGIVLFTKTLNIPHNSDGTKTLTCSSYINISVLTSDSHSYSQTLTTIPRKSSLTISDLTLGSQTTLTVTKASTSFTHTITYICGNDSETICTKLSSTSVTWTPKLSLGDNAPNGTQATIAISIETFNGDTSIGTNTYSVKADIPTNITPSVSINSVSDGKGYFSTYGAYIQNRSTLKIVLTASGNLNSTIRGYSTTVDGKTYTASSFETSVLGNSGTLTVKSTVTDSRARTASDSESISVLAYSAPKVSSVKARRTSAAGVSSSSGAYLTVTFNAAISSLNNKNSASYSVQYKKKSATSWTTAPLESYDGNYSVTGSYTFEADTSSAYDVRVIAQDDFEEISISTSGPSISVVWSKLARGMGFAFGKIATKENALEIGWDIYDKFDTKIGNGLASYSGGGDDGIDPNTTLESLCLTSHTNAPQGLGTFYYIFTTFYNTKSETAARSQLAFPYKTTPGIYYRYFADGAWSSWVRTARANELPNYLPLAGGTMTGTLVAPQGCFSGHAIGDNILLKDNLVRFFSTYENAVGQANRLGYIGYSSANAFVIQQESTSTIQLSNSNHGVRISSYNADPMFYPTTNGNVYLGGSSYRWKTVFATSGSINTSDRNLKKNIEDIDDRYIELFDKLQPVTFEFKNEFDSDSHDRVHIGYISQDIEAAMAEVGLTDLEFAGFCKDTLKRAAEDGKEELVLDENGNPVYIYSLRYSEFIALNSKMIQLNRERVKSLQNEVDELKRLVNELLSDGGEKV